MPYGTFPCKNCGDRYVGCHSKCSKYVECQAENERIKKSIRSKKSVDNDTLATAYKRKIGNIKFKMKGIK